MSMTSTVIRKELRPRLRSLYDRVRLPFRAFADERIEMTMV